MKKILAIAAVAALSAGVSAYAANPFSDVTPNDWAYQAVESLSEQGVVEGYPDGTFKGERNITRYEMAQIIARMLAKEDQLNAEQRATLDKLAGEYADELANLGVRVSNLEKKVGNLAWSGDARMQYQRNIDTDNAKSDSWTGRMRINVSGQVNDEVSVNGRLVSEMDFKDNGDKDVTMDRIFALWTPNDATRVSIGRQGVALDQTGVFWDEDGIYDGISAGWDNGSFGIEAGYGYLTSAAENYAVDSDDIASIYASKKDTENWYAKLTDTSATPLMSLLST
ncbi:MAG TPA: S-layer homology domain-containing protein [Veillonellaceae bacterium]|nr:S-layer homology domain-containing protein [Veillonellaceae bacterium]